MAAERYLEDFRDSADNFGSDYISPKEARVVEVVGSCLRNVNIEEYYLGVGISREQLIDRGFKSVLLLDSELEPMLKAIIDKTPINESEEIQRCNMGVDFTFEYEMFGRPDKDSIMAKLNIPAKPLEIDGIVLGHEFIHLMKDANYNELKSSLYIEALPMFLEFICFDKGIEFAPELLKMRIDGLGRQYEYYREFALESERQHKCFGGDFKGIGYRKSLEEFACTLSGNYLNSFYVALVLYNMYKDNPKKVLEMVRKVLQKEMITKDLCDRLGVISEEQDETFVRVFEELNKVLKKV